MKKSSRTKKAAKKTKPVKRAVKKVKAARFRRTGSVNFAVRKTLSKVAIEKTISVVGASYLHDNVLTVTFSNGKERTVDFSSFFNTNTTPYLKKYKSQKLFKNFKIEDGNIVWGKDWDLIFPVSQLYTNSVQ